MKKIYLKIVILLLVSACIRVNKVYCQSFKQSSSNSLINEVLSHINKDSIEKNIKYLESFGTRFMLAPNRKTIATWIQNRFIECGIDSVRIDSFQCVTNHYLADTITWQYNVIATIEGTKFPNDVILIGGHYDNFSTDSNPFFSAPGADDNASGTVALFEISRALMTANYKPDNTIELIAFAAEELMNSGYSGSRYHAFDSSRKGRNIIMMMNNDMIGFNNGNNRIAISNYRNCSDLTDLVKYCGNTYTNLEVALWPLTMPVFADVEPFYNYGYKCIYIEEDTFNPDYHTSADTVGNIDLDFCAEVIKMDCSSIMSRDIATSINDIYSEPILMRVFPNPVTNILNFDIPKCNNELQISLYNTAGIKLLECSAHENKIDVSKLPKMQYLIRIKSDKKVYQAKFTKY